VERVVGDEGEEDLSAAVVPAQGEGWGVSGSPGGAQMWGEEVGDEEGEKEGEEEEGVET
jgi:hypothetical protein